MKDKLITNKKWGGPKILNRNEGTKVPSGSEGFSTVEMLVAFAILIITITSVIQVTFGNQSVSVSSQTNHEAVYLAQRIIEDSRASSSHSDFSTITSIPETQLPDDIYKTKTEVTDISPCAKEVTGTVTWKEGLRSLTTFFSTLLTDPIEALALGGSCSSVGPGPDDWKQVKTNHGVITLDGNGTSIRARGNLVYVGSKDNNENLPDLSIADFSDIPNLTDDDFVKLPISYGPGKKLNGINDFELVNYPSLNKRYIFAAGVHGIPENPSPNSEKASGQLQIIDVTDFPTISAVASVSLPGVSGSCPDYCPSGRSIAFYDNKIYIGTHRVGGGEFHIFDVTNPTIPIHLGNTSATQVEHNINDIVITDGKAYLATSSDTEEVIVLDISNCSQSSCTITQIDSFDAKDENGNPSDENGQSLFFLNNRLYLGRDRTNNPDERDFYILDTQNNLAVLGSKRINTQNSSTISGIQVTGNLAFIASTDSNNPFNVWDVSDPSDIKLWDTCDTNFSVVPSDMYFDNNKIFIAATDQSDIRIIESSLSCN